MTRTGMTWAFAYDIRDDARRRHMARLLQDHLVRVQLSLFEGRLSVAAARSLSESAADLLAPGDSLRVYAISADGMRHTRNFGGAPILGDETLWLF